MPHLEIVAECDGIPNAVKSIHKHKPDLVFLDIEMPGHSGLEILDFFDEKFKFWNNFYHSLSRICH